MYDKPRTIEQWRKAATDEYNRRELEGGAPGDAFVPINPEDLPEEFLLDFIQGEGINELCFDILHGNGGATYEDASGKIYQIKLEA